MSTTKMTLRALAALVLATGVAFAQQPPAEEPAPTETTETGSARPDHGFAPPSDELPPPGAPVDENTGTGTGENVHAPGEHDAHHSTWHPTDASHFNFVDMGWKSKDAMGGPLGDGKQVDPHTGAETSGEEPMSAPFIFMILNFALLLGILAWKGAPVARKTAQERHDQIKEALDEAAKLREAAQKKLAEYETRLSDADAEIKALVEGIRKDAEADKARILENAEKQAAQMKRDAEQRIAAEIELARATLTREVTDAAAAATEKILRDKLQPTDQAKLVQTFISDMGSVSNARR